MSFASRFALHCSSPSHYSLRSVPFIHGFYSFVSEIRYFKGYYQFRDRASLLAQSHFTIASECIGCCFLHLLFWSLTFFIFWRKISRGESLSRKENRNKGSRVISSSDTTNMSKLQRIVTNEGLREHSFALLRSKIRYGMKRNVITRLLLNFKC